MTEVGSSVCTGSNPSPNSQPGGLAVEGNTNEAAPVDNVRRMWGRQGEGDEPRVLEPDHPLMKQFQLSLKAHLDRQNSRLTEEVLEIAALLRSRCKEREELGVNLFNMQQDVVMQQKVLNSHRSNLSSLAQMRREIELALSESKYIHKDEVEKLNIAKKKEAKLQEELECLSQKQQQLQLWTRDVEAELSVSQRISEKTRLEKKILAEEKRKQDLFLLRISTEVDRLEGEFSSLQSRCIAVEAERNTLCQTVADAQADLEAMGTEQRRLLRSWGSVVVALGIRDRGYNTVKQELSSVQERYQTLIFEIDGLKRSTAQEQERNEQLTIVFGRVENEVMVLDRQLKVANGRRTVLETDLGDLTVMLQQTDNDLALAAAESARHATDHKLLQKDVEKLSTEKVSIEDKIEMSLQDQITNSKATVHLGKCLRNLLEKSRHMETTVVEGENQLSNIMLQCTRQEDVIESNHLLLEELEKELANQEKEVDALIAELNRCTIIITKRQSNIDILNKKLETLLVRSGGEEMTPLELIIFSQQKSIEETVQKTEQLQKFWLRQQSNLVDYCQRRNSQLTDLDLLRKQVMLLYQKNLKIDYDIGRHNKQEQTVARSVSSQLNQLEILNLRLSEARGNKENLDKDNVFQQEEYIALLKEAEMGSLHLEAEISELEEEKIALNEKLVATQREQLAWERKLQLVIETKRSMKKELSAEGEVGSMRAEIHRMHVRLQLNDESAYLLARN